MRPDTALALSLSSTLKSSETARNSTGVLTTWIWSMQMTEFTTAGHGISLKSVPIASDQAAVRIIVFTAKATWND
jgi:hypothetical protein